MNSRYRFTTLPGGRIVRNRRSRPSTRRYHRDWLYLRLRAETTDQRRRANRGEFTHPPT